MTLLRLPRRFYDDHSERGLDTPGAERENRTHVWVRADDPALPELLSDARFYADPSGPDCCPPGIIPSAKATVAAIEKATEVWRCAACGAVTEKNGRRRECRCGKEVLW